ncbi:hypothetical protein TNCV_4231 [Trichonephila clavipes]|nr:hypothetical protein TNCV_4231 [Trichonephila clavipes]
MKTRHQKIGRKFARSFVDGLKDGEVQRAVRSADSKDLEYHLLYSLELEAATQESGRDRHTIRGASDCRYAL